MAGRPHVVNEGTEKTLVEAGREAQLLVVPARRDPSTRDEEECGLAAGLRPKREG
jgi:hypothetical protein